MRKKIIYNAVFESNNNDDILQLEFVIQIHFINFYFEFLSMNSPYLFSTVLSYFLTRFFSFLFAFFLNLSIVFVNSEQSVFTYAFYRTFARMVRQNAINKYHLRIPTLSESNYPMFVNFNRPRFIWESKNWSLRLCTSSCRNDSIGNISSAKVH